MPTGGRARSIATAIVVLTLASLVSASPARAESGSGPAEASSSDWRQVSAGGFHACGIRTSGRLYCWGWDDFGQLGDDAAENTRVNPTLVAGGFTDWVSVSAGDLHTCARRSNGRLYCWGDNSAGQLGHGTGPGSGVPVAMAGTTWTAVHAGSVHNCARRTSGLLFCWGSDNEGQLGNGAATTTTQAMPVLVAGTNWTAFTAGGNHSCARRANGRLFCWGDDEFGGLGDGGPNTDRAAPVQVAGGVTTWTAVTAGTFHTCGRRSSGRLFCWGDDSSGQLGDGGGSMNQPTPVQLTGATTDWALVDAGGANSCARKTTGELACWGSDTTGQLGDGGTPTDQPSPSFVAGFATDWASVSAGGGFACARTRGRSGPAGRLYCWGADFFGQLGDGELGSSSFEPVEVQL